MSVPVSKRSGENSQLQVLVTARKFCKYIYCITSNPKNFPITYSVLTTKVVDCATNIYLSLYTANNVKVTDGLSCNKRLGQSYQAWLECNNFLAYIDLLIDCFHLKTSRVSYITRQLLELRSMINKWRNADKERYKQYRGLSVLDDDILEVLVSKNIVDPEIIGTLSAQDSSGNTDLDNN